MIRYLYILIFLVAIWITGCSRSVSRHNRVIDDAEKIMEFAKDSAMAMLDAIDPSELTTDSVKAKYHYVRAYGHMKQNRSMIADSLIVFAHNFYRGKDKVRDIRSGMALAWYKFWVGDMPGAITLLDSIGSLPNTPDSLLAQTLRLRTYLGVAEYQGEQCIPVVKRLINLETDSLRKIEAKYLLLSSYENAEKFDSALNLLAELYEYAAQHNWGDKQFYFEVERAQLLTELGREDESDKVINSIFKRSAPDNGAADYLHMQHAINALNKGDIRRAARELAIADSFAVKFRNDDDVYYRSYSNLVRTMIDFKQTGRMKLAYVNGINNRQQERFNRLKASQWESERGALQQESRALGLKAENEHKTVIILIIGIAALLIAAVAAWIIITRRQHERENEERIEALQKMVAEYNSIPAPSQSETTNTSALRRAMLQQLGIIKMVAETPTEQNREMLRKISSIDGETKGELVNWDNLFELIDNLYSGFYHKLHERFNDQLTLKEEQIIVLMTAGFSTKEISVITGQTTSTIYVRKSSIRKKLGVPEKEDIVAFLHEKFSD